MKIRVTIGGFWLDAESKYDSLHLEQLKNSKFVSEDSVKFTDYSKGETGLFFEKKE